MKALQILFQIIVLYGFFLTGKWIQTSLDLIIPGSIIGMMLFFLLLLTGLFPTKWFEKGSELLLAHMPLMFLPVTVGVLNYTAFFQGKGMIVIVIVLISTMVVMVSSASIGEFIVKRKEESQQ